WRERSTGVSWFDRPVAWRWRSKNCSKNGNGAEVRRWNRLLENVRQRIILTFGTLFVVEYEVELLLFGAGGVNICMSSNLRGTSRL
ncbi:unnamed protein product, partial [Ectocarpus sp. 8 AP-2014]